MRMIGTAAAALSLLVGAFAFAGDADARKRHVVRHGHWNNHHHGRPLVAGALGFTAGTIFGNVIARPRYYGPAPYYYHPYPYGNSDWLIFPDPSGEAGDDR